MDMEALLDNETMDDKEATMIMDIESYEEEVDMSVFELPEGYTVIGQ